MLSKRRDGRYFSCRIVLSANKILQIIVSGLVAVTASAAEPPAVPREFRGLWVATVDNVDWPSKPNLTTRQQKAEFISILDGAVKLNLNVIVLQVRPACDAIYESKIEPWSEYLTGQMGRAPKPYYDPLAFAVEEAHKRGLELHAWFNPYRARIRDSKSPVARNHVTMTHPGLVRTYGSYLWLDPTERATQDYSFNVIMDVVRRYDIDGVHFDDYFYPYREKANGNSTKLMDFPDDASWRRYQKTGAKLSRNDWRRENVTTFVREVYVAIKKEKPWVKFGIAPFGIWQPHYPAGIIGLNSYDELYCDSRKWLANGWVDYLAPQLYWPVAQKPQSFPALLHWWEDQNTEHRLLLSGMKVNGWRGITNEARETINEIVATRRQPGADGEILWHSKPLLSNNAGVAAALRNGVYSEPALVPAWPWLGNNSPAQPILTGKENRREIKLAWREPSGNVWQWVVWKKMGDHWTTEILPGAQTKDVLKVDSQAALPEIIEVSAVNRYGNMSGAAVFNTVYSEK